MNEIEQQANQLNRDAESYLEKGEIDLAISYLEKAIGCYPEHAQAHNNMACAYVLQNNYPTALGYITKAYELDQNNQAIVLNTGDILTNLGVENDALLVYRTYLDINPDDSLVTEKISELEQVLAQTRPEPK